MEDELYEMKLPNGVGEQMLAHVYEDFNVELKQTEYGPKLLGTKEELEKVQDYIVGEMKKRLEELEKQIKKINLYLTFFIYITYSKLANAIRANIK